MSTMFEYDGIEFHDCELHPDPEPEPPEFSCPECKSENVEFAPFDFGIDSQTGYHDEGMMGHCMECLHTIDAEEFGWKPAKRQTSVVVAAPVAAAPVAGRPDPLFALARALDLRSLMHVPMTVESEDEEARRGGFYREVA
jgi:hypothetical protein